MRLHGWKRRGTAAFAAGIGLVMLAPAGAGAQLFFSTGEEAYDVPAGAGSLGVIATGAPGGAGDSGAAGGFGSTVQTTLPVTAGEVIYVDVGAVGPNATGATGGAAPPSAYAGGGANGGSVSSPATNGGGGAGGGASFLRTCSLKTFLCFPSPPLVVAGGGGGGGGGSGAGSGGAGDGAGGAGHTGGSAGPGLQTAGGSPGPGGTKGDLIVGGAGAGGSALSSSFYDGGGGGGLFGGGGGGASTSPAGVEGGGGGGGGGSSAVSSAATGTTITTDGTGIPQIMLTAMPMAPSCAGNALNTLPGGSIVSVVLPCTTPMGAPITYSIAGAPGHGTLGQVGQTTGTVSYTPAPGFTGADSFTFRATNSGGASSIATATITVPPAASTGQTPPGHTPPGRNCLVPKLKGSSLAAATRQLAAAGCALGKVTKPGMNKHRRPPKNLVVVSQGTKPGTKLRSGSRVAVTLGVAVKRRTRTGHG